MEDRRDCPHCKSKRTYSPAGTAGKGQGFIYQCGYCTYRGYPTDQSREQIEAQDRLGAANLAAYRKAMR